MEPPQQTVDIVMDRSEGSARADDNVTTSAKQLRETEVYENPGGGPSVILLEDEPDDRILRQQPIPPRKFAPPPLMPTKKSPDANGGMGKVYEEKKVLPESDLLNVADLAALANPEKMSQRKKGDEKKDERTAAPVTEYEDKPVPPKFPPPPKAAAPTSSVTTRRKSKPAAAPPPNNTPTVRSEPETRAPLKPALKRPSTPKAPQPVYQEEDRRYNDSSYDYEVVEQEPEYFSSRLRPAPERGGHYFRNPYEDDDDGYNRGGGRQRRCPPREPQYHYDVDRQRYYEPAPVMDDEEDQQPRRQRRGPQPLGREQQEQEDQAPRTPQVSQEELKRRREEDERKEKQELLHRLHFYEERGHNISGSFSMDSSVDELRFEVAKIKNERSAKTSVKWYKVFLMIITKGVEELNTRFDPFGLRLKDWSKRMHQTKDELDDCLYRLYDKHAAKTSIEPEMELMFAFFGGMFMYHLENVSEESGELGKVVKQITGGGAANDTKTKPKEVNVAVRKTPPGAFTSNQGSIMTNMPIFQQQPQQQQHTPVFQQQQPFTQQTPIFQQQPQQTIFQNQPPFQQQPQTTPFQQPLDREPPKIGPSGRKIMRQPTLAGANIIGMDAIAAMQKDEDVPIVDVDNMTIPISVGGNKVIGKKPATTSSATTASVATTSTKSKPASKKTGTSSRQSAPAPNASRTIKL